MSYKRADFQLILTKEWIWALLSSANLRADALQSERGFKAFLEQPHLN